MERVLSIKSALSVVTDSFANYAEVVTQFVLIGAEIINVDPVDRYGAAAADATRPLEPGYIPPDKPARLTIVSYYPNSSTLRNVQYGPMEERLMQWGRTGRVEDYVASYRDFLAALPHWDFYERWMKTVLDALDIGFDELAWLPLVKLPRPVANPPTEEMIRKDRDEVLKAQLKILKPAVVWVQSDTVYESCGGTIQQIQPRHVVQKMPKTSRASTSPQTPEVIRKLRQYLHEAAVDSAS